ncbi:MAG TPA: DUF4386 domain-containing protein [Candidatus Dormibacteraeota bacterium]|jgi:hypothetical protein|nr:DUF4386 domain-containing protein [Candidatus Dormibacteraeota bacterium]
MSSTKNPGRSAGLLYLVTSLVGFFAMGYVPGKIIVHGNTAATAANIAAHETLFRLGIAAQLIGMAGFIFVAAALYDLLKGVNRRHASLMVTLIVVSVPIAFLNEVNSIAAIVLARGADFLSIFEKPQREALAMLFLNLHHQGLVVAELFWGLWLFPLALLVYRSRFLPSFLGVWLAVAGIAWVILSLTAVLQPQYENNVYSYAQLPFFGEIALMLWLTIRGAKPPAPDAT